VKSPKGFIDAASESVLPYSSSPRLSQQKERHGLYRQAKPLRIEIWQEYSGKGVIHRMIVEKLDSRGVYFV